MDMKILKSSGIINYKSRTTLYLFGSKPSLFGIPGTGESGSTSGAPVYKQIDFTVHFKEVFESHVETKKVKWSANTGWDGNGYAVTPERFFTPMSKKLMNHEELIHRELDSVDVTVIKTSDFYNEYWAIKDYWDAFDRPPYTNFSNSYGMFISIARGTLTGLQLNWQAADSLYESKKYEPMKFVR